jgi:F420-dependent oxidoreductase-like protein
MRTSIPLLDVVRPSDAGFDELVQFVVDAERLGVDTVWSAEAWGPDGVVPLAYLAALTSRIRLASGVLQVSARSASMTAMTAITLDHLSGGRFVLGLGVSGPQVVEGLHGQPYDHPLQRLRETVAIVRRAAQGEVVEHTGQVLQLPLPGSRGRALRIDMPPRPELPIHLAGLGPKALQLAGEIGDGWVGTCFVPESAAYFLEHLRAGAAKAGRPFDAFELDAGGPVAITDDVERPLRARKRALAFQLSAMGTPTTNFYNDTYSRIGYADAAARVRRLWLADRRREAVDAVPDELAFGTSLIGTAPMVRARIAAYRDAGVTALRLAPLGDTATARLDTLAEALDMVADANRPAP